MRVHTISYDSPMGRLTLVGAGEELHAILWPHEEAPADAAVGSIPILARTATELDAYFTGKVKAFSVRRAVRGTEFQRQVWAALTAIPFGETTSYAAIARAIGRPTASRAVGAAIGSNPWPIIIPCHRVVGSGGQLTGFQGGLPSKAHLLRHESAARFALTA